MAMACSSESKGMRVATRPKISSRTIALFWFSVVKTMGDMKKPGGQGGFPGGEGCAIGLALFDVVAQHPGQLLLAHQWPHLRAFGQTVAHFHLLDRFNQHGLKLIEDAALDKDATARCAKLALIVKDSGAGVEEAVCAGGEQLTQFAVLLVLGQILVVMPELDALNFLKRQTNGGVGVLKLGDFEFAPPRFHFPTERGFIYRGCAKASRQLKMLFRFGDSALVGRRRLDKGDFGFYFGGGVLFTGHGSGLGASQGILG